MSHREPTPTVRAAAPHPVLDKYYARDADRTPFVGALFDGAAPYYEWMGGIMSLGSEHYYRRLALRRGGVAPGMKVLDVATGTGLLARAALRVVGQSGVVVGVDPSRGMLGEQSRKATVVHLVQGRAEALPFESGRFDALTMGFALRHVADLGVTFKEYLRVLKPGGRVVILEVSRPASPLARWLFRVYLQRLAPLLARLRTRNPHAAMLMRYYWDTIDECVPPGVILDVLKQSGFVDVDRRLSAGLLSEYTGTRPR
jgi:demethylmenaquinone methyltransferase / 2-methoxy-6-polyprenyl-1,4-benzoquinol methylase